MWDRIKAWSLKTKLIVGGIVFILLIAIAGGGEEAEVPGSVGQPEQAQEEEEPQEQAQEGPTTEVDWENYAPSVKTRIDAMAKKGKCAGLQKEFDIAESNSDIQRARVGDGNADLMGYIDEQLRAAGCYKD